MRPSPVAIALAVAAVAAACSSDEPPTGLAFAGYEAYPVSGRSFRLDVTADRLNLGEQATGPSTWSSAYQATLTAEGAQRLADAMVDVKAEWDDFPACEACTPVEIYRFTSDDGALVVLTSPSAMRPLDPIIDELRVELMACSGSWIQQCVELP